MADRKMANTMDSVLGHHTPEERQPATIPELSHNQPHEPSQQSYVEDSTQQTSPTGRKDPHQEQPGFRAGRSTTEKIFKLWILCEKYLQNQQDLYNVFIDLKKAFRVWHAVL